MKRSFLLLSFLILCFACCASMLVAQDKFFVIVIPSYNNINWYQRNLDELFAQEKHHTNWYAVYIDDCSKDGTGPAVVEYVRSHNFEHKFTVIKNEQNRGALANLYCVIHQFPDDAIIITYDGDDWFYDEYALAYLNEVYQDEHVWMTYGQYVEYPTGNRGICQPIPDVIVEQNLYRQATWVTSHPRTFYAHLFKRIKLEDLLWEGGFFPVTWDLAIMFPMLEMARHHARFIDRYLYVYNIDNPINDFKKDLGLMFKINAYIRGKQKYSAIVG